AEVAALLEGYLSHLRQPALSPAPVLPPVSDVDPAGQLVDRPGSFRLPSFSSFLRAGVLLLLVLVLLGGSSALLLLNLNDKGQGNAGDARPKEVPADPYVVWSVAVTPDGKTLAAGAGWWTTGGEVGIWDLATYKPLRHIADERGVGSVAF